MSREFGAASLAELPRVERLEVLDGSEFVYLRILTGEDVPRILEYEELEPSEKWSRYVALFLANEDGSPRFPDPTPEQLAEISGWPASVTVAIVNRGAELNRLQVDHSGN